MSNETRGELAEAIAVVALERATAGRSARVFWEERPSDALVLPDITIGADPASPSHVVLVTACDTPRSSAMKYWRDLGEIFDTKSGSATPPRIISLVFRSSIKEELIRLEGALCDSVLLVDRDTTFGAAITSWLEANHADAPSKKEKKKALIEEATAASGKKFDSAFAAAMKALSRTLRASLDQEKTALASLWRLCRQDTKQLRGRAVREPKTTLFRRGIARWVVIDAATRNLVFEAVVRRRPVPTTAVSGYEADLGILTRRTSGYALRQGGGGQDMLATVGADLSNGAEFFLGAAGGDANRALAGFGASMSDVPDYMLTVAAQLRATPPAVRAWHEYATASWSKFVDPWELYSLFRMCDADESMNGEVTAPSTGRVWIYDHCIALLRASSGRLNDFGYGPLGSLFQRESSSKRFVSFLNRVMNGLPEREQAAARRWAGSTLKNSSEPGRRGFQDWLAREKRINSVVIASYSFALATMLSEAFGKTCQVGVEKVVAAHAYALWNKLLTYPEFEGLPGLVLAACGDKVQWVTIQTLMAEIAGETVQDAGALRVLGFERGLIFWVSATDAGRGHKVKELSAKARCLRHQYTSGTFSRREAASRLFLVVDGTFSGADLEALKNAGWDELFYPDEMDKLVKAIV
jgi:hypothetical protein